MLRLVATQFPNSPFADMAWSDLPFNHIGVLSFLIMLFVFDLLYCGWITVRGICYRTHRFACRNCFRGSLAPLYLEPFKFSSRLELIFALR